MKPEIHPEYRYVVFRDISAKPSFEFLTRSCIDEKNFRTTTEIDGVEYPVVTIDISSASHPFYTGTQKIMDTEGRVEAYYRKYGFAKPPEPEEEGGEEAAPEAEA